MKHRCIAFLLILLLLLCGCTPVERIELPERTPEPTQEPVPTATPVPSPTPEPTPTPIPVPEDLESLGDVIGVDLYAPEEPLEGMFLTSIGYDGDACAAIKYTNNTNGYLLYTISKGTSEPTFTNSIKITVNGIEVSVDHGENTASQVFRCAHWLKNGNTYHLLADPAQTEDDLHSAVSAMISAPRSEKAPSTEFSTIEELSAAVGFSVKQPTSIPKKYSPIHIYALYGQIPVQIYSNDTTEITFIKSEGSLIPPRFSSIEYTSAGEYKLPDGSNALLYYTENGVSLAEWTVGGYGYSISVTDTDGNPIDIKKKTFYTLIDGFYEYTSAEETEQ